MLTLAPLHGPAQGRPKILLIGCHSADPGHASSTHQVRLRLLGEGGKEVSVPLTHGLGFATGIQYLERELTDRLEHEEP